ncbi:response regulator receiver [Gemmatirosa kalamazoonensis]|uniref:Response regulator receiver n=1 Tax=Gemmatirosa kalamazoonensis TaxID=861299 RepID=W0RB53_9BACT|nr:LytTR family DNA-binding domain-containing protein [Gemmatirosa kalamazoonensis]AHG88319.1 response regulator receiver [Gemmatirosa kalamazoonensis]
MISAPVDVTASVPAAATAARTHAALRVLVVDDERLARQRLRRLLGAVPGVTVIAEASSGGEALDLVPRLAPDLLLLDVQMPELDGFGVLARLADVARQAPNVAPPLVVFVTAFDEYAVRAFEVHAVDYVLKPVDPARLVAAVERARETRRTAALADAHVRLLALATSLAPGADAPPAADPMADRIYVKDRGKGIFVRIPDIDYVEALGNYARIHAAGSRHMLREKMAVLEQRLAPHGFARVHRSAIVNLDRVREVVPRRTGDHVVVLTGGVRLKLSRSYRDRIPK